MPLKQPLGYILGKTMRVYRNKLTAEFKENNVDLCLGQYIMLAQIYLNESVSQQELADHLQADKSAVMRQINTLIEKDYVKRRVNQQDKRKKNLILTPGGHKIFAFTKSLALEVSEELLTGTNSNEQHIFEQVIQRIIKNGSSEDETLR
ncbi:MarR family winged helix-turn-helix transcriptional regulator [Geofilum sp. OHC36d9]|uniref:MarR family winged helix-turn-helix transcriptional regulator n=1 Tax=Geofilum sp. OHC36d9 TaxID=3458413 RepID=UPI004034D6A8